MTTIEIIRNKNYKNKPTVYYYDITDLDMLIEELTEFKKLFTKDTIEQKPVEIEIIDLTDEGDEDIPEPIPEPIPELIPEPEEINEMLTSIPPLETPITIVEPATEQPNEQPIVETVAEVFPEFKSREDFCEILNILNIGTLSHKNYWTYWNSPILDNLRIRKLDTVVELLKDEIKKIETNKTGYAKLYNFFTLIFKLNTHYKIFEDETAIRELFVPVKAHKNNNQKKKNETKREKIDSDWKWLCENYQDWLYDETDIWLKICFASYFDIECLRNDYYNAVVVETEVDTKINQYIMSKRQFKYIVGKTPPETPIYYDIPENSLVWKLLTENYLQLTDRTQKRDDNYWQYQSRRIFSKSGIELNGGLINHLRICKSKYIENLEIDIIEKNKLHKQMLHSYEVTLNYYSGTPD